ncbi:MAG: acetone carboxylase [Rothia sp. (in: high G+C Gram-positive bacteria)]|nr:acetone carboxylase [Rothia sp. (in: high G+C Gram-positive bacteria)]
MDLLGSLSAGNSVQEASEQPVGFLKCSRKGCLTEAKLQVLWNNPKIHEPSRRKVWLACEEHADYLQNFLVARGFWQATEPLPTPGMSFF